MFFNQSRPPRDAQVQNWLRDLSGMGYTTVRTGALAGDTASLVEQLGFRCIQQLALLEHTEPASVAPAPIDLTHRLLVAQHARASVVDQAAFPPPWALDDIGIDDVRHATPRHRARGASVEGQLVGYAISGRDGRQGFLQRLAVSPSHQGHGHGRALVIDSMRWFARWRVNRVLVNTHTDNAAALSLYHQLGFVTLPETLRVFERVLP